MPYEFILTETIGRVSVITLNRPAVLNALSSALMAELGDALQKNEEDAAVAVTVITGGEKVFAAGADIKEMMDQKFSDVFMVDFPNGKGALWRRMTLLRKPVIAAVAGFALGGGCELAMACDFILAADTARFGQPEINVGTIPGAGGTQRLTRALGKAKAMEMVLSGRLIDAAEAERAGLVSRVVPAAELRNEALKVAAKIAGLSLPAVMMAKEAVNAAFETTLSEGLRLERRSFHSTFATEDQKEGMKAFSEKRKPDFKNR